MKHRVKKGRKLSRDLGHRQALLRNLLTSLVVNGRIVTTLPKAKELKVFSDRVFSRASATGFSGRRKIFSLISNKMAAEKLFIEVLPRFGARSSGYTRIVKLGRRISDGSERARIELVEELNEDKSSEADTD